jgi:hypothetical protein
MGELSSGHHRARRPPDGDERLLDALRRALAASEPVPAHVADGVRAAFAMREVPVLPAAGARLRPPAARRRRGR